MLQVAGCQLLPVVLRLLVRWPRLNGLSITSNNESPFTNLAEKRPTQPTTGTPY